MNYLLIAIVVAVSAIAALQWLILRKARQMQGSALPEVDVLVAQRLRERGKALLYFFSPHCGPCRAMTPIIERLSHQFDNVFLFDVSQDLAMAKAFRVRATPTVLTITRETVTSVLIGHISAAKLEKLKLTL